MIRDFYEIGLQGEETKFAYPVIQPEVMASLSELLDMPLTVSDVVIRIQLLLRELADQVEMGGLKPEEMELYTFYLNRVFERNQKMLARG